MANEVKCPKCGSEQISANKKGFSLGRAVAGTIAVGALAGTHGSSDVIITCLSCGNSWEPKVLAAQIAKEQIKQVKSQRLYKEPWQRDFVDAYETGDRVLANSILRLNSPALFSQKGIDQVYNDLPTIGGGPSSNDPKQNNVIAMISIAILIVIGILLISKLF